jgi:hypothetical protein
MPALKSPSVIVLDNASYHNIKTEETVVPNFNQRKSVVGNFISFKNGKEFLKFDFFIKLFFSFKGLKRNVVF